MYIPKKISVIGNGFVEISHNQSKVIYIGFDNNISNESIFIGAVDTFIDLPNGTILDHMNDTPLPDVGTNSLIYTLKTFEFYVDVQNIYKHNGG